MIKRKGSKISIEGKEVKIKRIDLPPGSVRLCVFCVPCRPADSGRVGYKLARAATPVSLSLSAQICAVNYCTYLNRQAKHYA